MNTKRILTVGGFIMLIADRCYFCLDKQFEHVVMDGSQELHLCSGCYEQYQECTQNTEQRTVLDLPHNNPSDICTKCGLCCLMLCAKVEEEEAHKFISEAKRMNIYPQDITFEQFCTLQTQKPYEGEYTINMPCRYLQGSILKYTGCRAYHIDRPKVCGNYLCKVAVEYKIGRISIDQALFSLRSAFMNGSVSVFNWSYDLKVFGGYEDRISLLSRVSDLVKELRSSGVAEEVIEFAVASQITPTYLPSSDVTRTLFDMHMFNVDRGDYDLKLYVPELVGRLNEVEEKIALNVVKAVLSDLRKLFIRGDEVGMEDEFKSGGDGVRQKQGGVSEEEGRTVQTR